MSKFFFTLIVSSALFSADHLRAMENDYEKNNEKKSRYYQDRHGFKFKVIDGNYKKTKESHQERVRYTCSNISEADKLDSGFIAAQCYKKLEKKEKALSWLKKTAKSGHLSSQLTLAYGFLNGEKEFGIEQNPKKAYKWSKKAYHLNPQDKFAIEYRNRAKSYLANYKSNQLAEELKRSMSQLQNENNEEKEVKVQEEFPENDLNIIEGLIKSLAKPF